MTNSLCWDLETERFGPSNLAPEPICLSMCDGETSLVVAACEPSFDEILEHCLKSQQVNTNIAFDMAVVLAHRPKLAPLVWEAYQENRVSCLIVREKLKVLADTGDLSFVQLPNGAKMKLSFSQLAMEKKYLGIDRGDEKEDEDAWRSNYSVLKGRPAKDYPKEAYDYSLADAVNGRAIAIAQGPLDMEAEFLNARAALALYLSSCWGFPIDSEFVDKLHAELSPKYHESHYPHLLQAGLLEPSVPTTPYANQLAKAVALLGKTPLTWDEHVAALSEKGIRFTQPKEAKKNTKAIRQKILDLCKQFEMPVKMTDASEKFPDGQVSYGDEALQELKGLDPCIDELLARDELQKLVTTEIPRMRAGRVHPKYDVIKKTGRTSSYGNSKKDKDPAYPAVNIQNIDPRVRAAYIASPGNVLCSVDYNAIELVSIAQKCLTLFGKSVLAEKINAGADPHAFLGAEIARLFDGFRGSYEDFLQLKKTDPAKFKHWRTLAKPTGLGFPGGLGAARFLGYAKSTFGVDIIKIAGSMDGALEMARTLKRVWLDTFPEMQDYFNWITRDCKDLDWSGPDDDRYVYVSPHGMIRRNCFYTEATNGAALQTPTAEGAKISLWNLARALYDATVSSILRGCHMLAFVHDEVIVEIPHDEVMHERGFEIAKIMREGMQKVMTQVKVGASPACMFRWNKDAETVLDSNGRLQVWTPKVA